MQQRIAARCGALAGCTVNIEHRTLKRTHKITMRCILVNNIVNNIYIIKM